MTTGDPKQAIILAVVAIGSIGFVVYRVIPKGEPSRSIPLSPRAAQTPKAEVKAKLPTIVISNAFWHSKISEKGAQNAPPPGSRRIIEVEGEVRPLSPFAQGFGPIPPVGNTGSGQQLKQGPTISVQAIIGTDGRREALIHVGGTDRKVRVSSMIEDIAVVAITDTLVRFRIGDRTVAIAVGEEKQL